MHVYFRSSVKILLFLIIVFDNRIRSLVVKPKSFELAVIIFENALRLSGKSEP